MSSAEGSATPKAPCRGNTAAGMVHNVFRRMWSAHQVRWQRQTPQNVGGLSCPNGAFNYVIRPLCGVSQNQALRGVVAYIARFVQLVVRYCQRFLSDTLLIQRNCIAIKDLHLSVQGF